MSSKVDFFLKKTLGEDFLESLQKTELYKPATRTTTSLEDIHHGLKIVPRTILSFLIKELVPMNIGENKEIKLPLPGNANMHVDKLGPDVYSGHIEEDHKRIAEFQYRPVPGVALVLMSTFELYDVDSLNEEKTEQAQPDQSALVQKLIDDRLALHDLINKVVDQKMQHRDAIQQLILSKLTHSIEEKSMPKKEEVIEAEEAPLKKGSPLKDFLDNRSNKLKKNEFFVSLEKHEKVSCEECGKEIFNASGYSGCICYGENQNSQVSMKKTENGVKLSFGRGWDKENLEMLLEVLRSKNGK